MTSQLVKNSQSSKNSNMKTNLLADRSPSNLLTGNGHTTPTAQGIIGVKAGFQDTYNSAQAPSSAVAKGSATNKASKSIK